MIDLQLKRLEKQGNYWSSRLYNELLFLKEYDQNFGSKFFKDNLLENLNLDQSITKDEVLKIEESLSEASKEIKKLSIECIAHAHLDMNWMWRYDETVGITISTFRTILNFMKEYKELTFAQSQASTYEIIEKYAPEMLDEIKAMIKEGRWEVTASTWVETDKNMPSGEALARHILYTKEYLSKLLDISPDYLDIDFEPDTFGHNANVPEIMVNGGVKHYYHCRGYQGEHIYNWESNYGQKVLSYREPFWYNAEIDAHDFLFIPSFGKRYGLTRFLKVYGVGDHGGGPTRRDINRIIDFMSWPLLPTIKFGTFHSYFDYLETKKDTFKTVKGELNGVLTGCFTTETRIKRFNKFVEKELYESEFATSAAKLNGYDVKNNNFKDAWKNVLFNNFHDIIPGSGVIDTREHAMGKYQDALAITSSKKTLSLSHIAGLIDISKYKIEKDDNSTSNGAGGGYLYSSMNFGIAERNNNGNSRIYHLFNSSSKNYNLPSVITLFDYQGDINNLEILVNDKPVEYQLLDQQKLFYWSHVYQRILVNAEIPAFGYTTVLVKEKDTIKVDYRLPDYIRVEKPDEDFVLENEYLYARFDMVTCDLVELIDKRTGNNVTPIKGRFQLIEEDASKEMSAWTIGRYRSIKDLNDKTQVRQIHVLKGNLRNEFNYEVKFNQSKLNVKVTLDKNSKFLKYECHADYKEQAVRHEYVPMLAFRLDTQVGEEYTSDIQFGLTKRKPVNLDMPSLHGVYLKSGLSLVSDGKYGFRTMEDGVRITLIRNSYEPDTLPDCGDNDFGFAIGLNKDQEEFQDNIDLYIHSPSEVSHNFEMEGKLKLEDSFFGVEGARVSSFKISEKEEGYVIRLYDVKEGTKLSMPSLEKAYYVDLNENIKSELEVSNHQIQLKKGSIISILLKTK